MEELIRLVQARDEAEEELKLAIKVTDEEREIAANMLDYWKHQQCGAE